MRKSALGILVLTMILLGSCQEKKSAYQTVTGYAQGGTYHITYSRITADGKETGLNADEVHLMADSLLALIDQTFSGYNRKSMLSHINSGTDTAVSPMFAELFEISKAISKETYGYFDITGAPLFDAWGFGFRKGEFPTDRKIDSILQFVGMDKIRIDRDGRVIKDDPRVQLNFNAIAQGYSCDIIAAELEKAGIRDYLVEVGMEIMCKGHNAKGEKWKIGIDSPVDGNNEAGAMIQRIVDVSDCGIVTSGNYRKFYIMDGKKYSHSINPKTGRPVTHNLLSATIIARNATVADAYATYCMVVGYEQAKSFIESRTDIDGVLIYEADGEFRTYCSMQDN